jgi:hypothetical protein
MPTYTHGRENSIGMDIMRRINDGELHTAPSEEIEKVKEEITQNCEELIEVGARIRPLLVEGKQVGWVRGIHLQERRILKRWVRDPNDYVALTLQNATTFTREEIEAMQAYEIRSLVEVVRRMSDYDLSLYPYLQAYVTTASSEALWYSKGDTLVSYESKVLTLPDGKKMTIMAPPDHARMWSTLSTYREQAKARLEDNTNALFIVRPWAGRAADPIANELKGIAKQLETGTNFVWENIIRVEKKVDVNDGWGHPGDSLQDLQRELKGMMEGDRHERMMEAWQAQMVHEAEVEKQKIIDARKKQGKDESGGLSEGRFEILTEAQIKARQAALAKGKKPVTAPARSDYEQTASSRQLEKIKKYR